MTTAVLDHGSLRTAGVTKHYSRVPKNYTCICVNVYHCVYLSVCWGERGACARLCIFGCMHACTIHVKMQNVYR